MKQYIKNKPIKQGFKYWYRYDSETGYVCQLEFYQGQIEKRKLNLGLIVVLDFWKVLRNAYCHVFLDNLFSSPTLIQKLHDNGLYGLGTVRSNRINMPQMEKDKFYSHIACIKWYDNKSVMLFGSHFEEITSILTVQRRLKRSSSKIPVNCPNGIKLNNRKMGEVKLMDQLKSAYQLD